MRRDTSICAGSDAPLVGRTFEFRVSGFGFLVSGFGFRVSSFEFRVSGFEFRVSGFEFRVSGFGFRVSSLRGMRGVRRAIWYLRCTGGFGVRVFGCGFRVPGCGFRIPGFRSQKSGIDLCSCRVVSTGVKGGSALRPVLGAILGTTFCNFVCELQNLLS